MKYTLNSNYTREWNDEFQCVCIMENGTPRLFVLSKRKLMIYFSELKTLSEVYMFILDNLSNLEQLTYHLATKHLVLKVNNNGLQVELEIPSPFVLFDDILSYAILKQIKIT